MGNCGLSPFGKKEPAGAPAPEAEPEKTEDREVVVGETSQTTETTEVKEEATPTETVTAETTTEATPEASTAEAEKKEETAAA